MKQTICDRCRAVVGEFSPGTTMEFSDGHTIYRHYCDDCNSERVRIAERVRAMWKRWESKANVPVRKTRRSLLVIGGKLALELLIGGGCLFLDCLGEIFLLALIICSVGALIRGCL